MKVASTLLVAAGLVSTVQCDWISSFKDFAYLQYWYGDDNSGSPFNPLRWLGGNGQWFPGPDVYNLGIDPPEGCTVDQAVYILRHGSRNPDAGAYAGWVTLYNKIRNSTFTATGPLSFLSSWAPVLTNPTYEMSTESITGYREAYDLAIQLRTKYPTFYTPGESYHVFANDYPRVIETAQNFLRAYIGVNASEGLGTVYAVTSTGSGALGNSLAPSDLCPSYVDSSGANQTAIWNALYEPAIVSRLEKYITSGSLNITGADTATGQYLCGFETSITGLPSPWCSVFEKQEFMDYEYTQDLRYYYGNGPGSVGNGKYMMFPLLESITGLLSNYSNSSTSNIQPLTMGFLNDGQVSQLVSQVGVFDDQAALPTTSAPTNRLYYASRFVSMRGTIAFERLSCPAKGGKFVRIRLNDAVYPVPSCQDGPGKSCAVDKYASYVAKKDVASGGFLSHCGANTTLTSVVTNFWTNYANLSFIRSVVP